MPEIRTIFRHCPSCGRRFEIRLVSKEQVDEDEHVEDVTRLAVRPVMMARGVVIQPLVVHEGSPVTVDVETFQYTYRCKHCGHQWSEVHSKSEEATDPGQYTGD